MSARPALASSITAAITAALLVGSVPARAADPAEPACAPTVSMALTAWDKSIAAASAFGESAANMAREKGREYLLPLLGIDPKTAQPQPGAPNPTDEVGRELEASRDDPARREALCMAITLTAREMTAQAGATAEAGLDALRGALDRFLPQQPQSPQPAPQPPVGTEKDGLIRT